MQSCILRVTYQGTLYFFILKSRDRLQTREDLGATFSFFLTLQSSQTITQKKDRLQNFNTRRTLEQRTKNPDYKVYIRETQHDVDGTASNASSCTCIHQTQQERRTGKGRQLGRKSDTNCPEKKAYCRRRTLSYDEPSRTALFTWETVRISSRDKFQLGLLDRVDSPAISFIPGSSCKHLYAYVYEPS